MIAPASRRIAAAAHLSAQPLQFSRARTTNDEHQRRALQDKLLGAANIGRRRSGRGRCPVCGCLLAINIIIIIIIIIISVVEQQTSYGHRQLLTSLRRSGTASRRRRRRLISCGDACPSVRSPVALPPPGPPRLFGRQFSLLASGQITTAADDEGTTR
jgi:hypothetical protein